MMHYYMNRTLTNEGSETFQSDMLLINRTLTKCELAFHLLKRVMKRTVFNTQCALTRYGEYDLASTKNVFKYIPLPPARKRTLVY